MAFRVLVCHEFLDEIEHGPDVVVRAPEVGVLVDRFLQVLDLVPHLAYVFPDIFILLLVFKHEPIYGNLFFDFDFMFVLNWLIACVF